MVVEESTSKRAISPTGRYWLIAGVLITVIVIMVGGTFVMLSLFGSATPTEEQQHQAYQRSVSRVELDVDSGDISISAGGSGQVVVERLLRWRKTKPQVGAEWDGDTLHLSGRCPDQKDCTVSYQVRVPAGVSVRAHTIDGNISVADVTGELDLRNESGDVTVRNSAGPVRIMGDAGNVTGTGLRSGSVDLQTKDGDVALAFAAVPTSVRVVLTDGSVKIAVPRTGTGIDGYHVQASTAAGQRNVHVDEDSAGKRSIYAQLVAGDVTVDYS